MIVARRPLGVCAAIIPWNMPVLIMGWKIGHGNTYQPTKIVDMAATVCALLNIQMPNACIGTAILPVLESTKK